MLVTMLKSKIHRATVTDANLNYEGSISIDKKLMIASGIYKYEKVDVLNINNGERLSTYVVSSENTGEICLNGAAAKKCNIGDLIIIVSYVMFEANIVLNHWEPSIVKVDGKNNIII
jgi:aspartate 1-decarboxylase